MGDKIRISVKGDTTAARAAMIARGIRGELVEVSKKVGGQCQSFWDVPAWYRAQVVSWYCEPAVCSEPTGFPAGTLLHHG